MTLRHTFHIRQTRIQETLAIFLLATFALGSGCSQSDSYRSAVPGTGPDSALEADREELGTASPPELLVREAQFLLTELNLRPGPIDGLPGPRTRAAVTVFQDSVDGTVDGRITFALVEEMWAQVHHKATQEVRERLSSLGYDPGPPDGTADPQMIDAVKQFQSDEGFKTDGKVDWNLLQQLRAADETPQAPVTDSPEMDLIDKAGKPDGAKMDRFASIPHAEAISEPPTNSDYAGIAPGDTILVYVSAWDDAAEKFRVNENGLLVLRGGVSLKVARRSLHDLEDALMMKLLEQHIAELSAEGRDEESIAQEASQFLLDLQVELRKEI